MVQPPLSGLSEAERARAFERYELLRPALDGEVPLARVARDEGVALRTARRRVAQYRREGLAGLARKGRSDRGRRHLSDTLHQVIEGLALGKPHLSAVSIHREVIGLAERLGEPTPSYSTVYAVVRALDPALVTLAHEGSKAYADAFDLIHRHEADAPNAVWQADHTELDVWVDDGHGQPAKPWLTIILDDYSRAVAGYALFFGSPSAIQTALALQQAIWRKARPGWEVCGIPGVLYSDHGSDFTSRHLEQVAADLKIRLVNSMVGRPRGRGKIERFFKGVAQVLLPRLPGYAPGGAVPKAGLTLAEITAELERFLIDEYHNEPHTTTGSRPQERWTSGGFLPRMPESLERLDLLLLTVPKTRRVHSDGIRFSGLRYIDPTLAAYVGEDVLLRYDPRDVAEVRVFHEDRFVCRAVCQELAGETVPLREVIRARERRRRELRRTIQDRRKAVESLLEARRGSVTESARPPQAITLAPSTRLVVVENGHRWRVEEFHPDLRTFYNNLPEKKKAVAEGLEVLRRFNVRLDTPSHSVVFEEVPSLPMEREVPGASPPSRHFRLHSDGLPPPVRAHAIGGPIPLAQVVPGMLQPALRASLRAALDSDFGTRHTPINLDAAHVRVVDEEVDQRWRVLLDPEDSTPNELHPSLTLRKSGASEVRLEPPGCSLRPTTPARLRDDLAILGFGNLAGDGMREGLRQFQAYAKGRSVARLIDPPPASPDTYADTLEPVANTMPYTGPVSGEANPETAALIDHWISARNRLRCPVVVQSCTDASGDAVVNPNLWGAAEDSDPDHRMFVVDFTGGTRVRQRLGAFAACGLGPRSRNDPDFRPCQPAGEVTPERMTGSAVALTDAEKKVFRIVRAVCEVACGGFLDGIDASTAGITSLGPFVLRDEVVGAGGAAKVVGGLGALFALAREFDLRDFRPAIEDAGLQSELPWHTLGSIAHGERLWDKATYRHLGAVAFERNGYPLEAPPSAPGADPFDLRRLDPPLGPTAAEALRDWHWAHRLAQAARRPGFGKGVWELLRIRLRDLGSLPWPDDTLNAVGSTARPTLDDVFTSETAWAILLYWHLRAPGQIVRRTATATTVHPDLAQAVADVGLNTPPAGWTGAEESRLLDALTAYIATKYPSPGDPFPGELLGVAAWPAWTTPNPADNPSGFGLDQAGLISIGAPTPAAGHPADLDAGTVPPAVLSEIGTLTGDGVWAVPGATPGVTPLRMGNFWLVTLSLRSVGIVLRGPNLEIVLGLRPGRHAFTSSPAVLGALPPRPYALSATGSATSTALVELTAPTFAGSKHRFGVSLVSTVFDDAVLSGPRAFQEVVFTRSGALPTDPPTGLRVPLNPPALIDLKLDTSVMRVASVARPGAEAEELPLISVAPDTPIPPDQDLSLDISELVDPGAAVKLPAAKLRLAGLDFDAGLGHLVGTIRTALSMDVPFLNRPFDLSFAAAGDDDPADFGEFAFDETEGTALFDPAELDTRLLSGFPIGLPDNASFELLAGLSGGKLMGTLSSLLDDSDHPTVDLGSPLARLTFRKPVALALSLQDGLTLSIPDGEDLLADLDLDLFAEARGATTKVINHLWEDMPGAPDIGRLLRLSTPGPVPDVTGALLSWRDRRPIVSPALFEAFTQLVINDKRRLRSFAGDLLGTAMPGLATFRDAAAGALRFAVAPDGLTYRLEVPLRLVLGGESSIPDGAPAGTSLLEADGMFGFEVGAVLQGGSVRLSAASFRVDPEVTLRVVDRQFASGYRLGPLMSIHVPEGTAFTFRLDPRDPSFFWNQERTREATPANIVVRVPASDGIAPGELPQPKDMRFSFEIGELGLASRGFDLKGAARAEKVGFGDELDSGFDRDTGLGVQRPQKSDGDEPSVGELRFSNSRLTHGSLQASCKLRYFDDATGTFRVAMAQDPATQSLRVDGSFDITGIIEFRLEALFCLFRLSHVHLGTSWNTAANKWESEGRMTGSVAFQPARGHSAGEVGPLSELFSGISCEFEDLNPVKIGHGTELTFRFPPKRFEFAEVFLVDLSGITIGKKPERDFKLIGDVTLQNLPGVDSRLTFGGITLIGVGGPGAPSFTVDRIGVALTTSGGFSIEGEIGFGGAVTIQTDALPPLSGLVKLTLARADDGKMTPSLAVYFEADYELPLFAEFYLRSLGVGLGINQALRGLEYKPGQPPLAQRISRFVDDPEGLPNPRTLAAWVPNPPPHATDTPNWMLVAAGLITLTKEELDTTHPMVGSVLVALDNRLQLTMALTGWLFVSPNEARSEEFQRNPVARGAVAFSPREQTLSAYFRTLPNPRLGKDAPELLGKMLNSVRTTFRLQADRNGLMVEVGWPWETRAALSLPAPLRGTLTAGFRYGLYRGALCFGLNFAIDVGLDAEAGIDFRTPIGDAGASLKVSGSGYFRCSFAGAIDSSMRPLLLGDVRLGATVLVSAEAHVSLSKKISKWFKIKLRIDFSASFNISISAALTAALDADGIGFRGDAHVSVSVKGYRIAGNVAFQLSPDKIEAVRGRLEELLPPPINGGFAFAPVGMAPLALATPPTDWVYRQRRVRDGKFLAVSLLPQPGRDYPGLKDGFDPNDPLADPGTRYELNLTALGASRFRGFLGDADPPIPGVTPLIWTENLGDAAVINDARGDPCRSPARGGRYRGRAGAAATPHGQALPGRAGRVSGDVPRHRPGERRRGDRRSADPCAHSRRRRRPHGRHCPRGAAHALPPARRRLRPASLAGLPAARTALERPRRRQRGALHRAARRRGARPVPRPQRPRAGQRRRGLLQDRPAPPVDPPVRAGGHRERTRPRPPADRPGDGGEPHAPHPGRRFRRAIEEHRACGDRPRVRLPPRPLLPVRRRNRASLGLPVRGIAGGRHAADHL